MIKACRSSRDRALISVQYEAATRIGELGRMVWRDILFDDHGTRMTIHDTKTKKIRFSRLTDAISAKYLAAWRGIIRERPKVKNPFFCRNGEEHSLITQFVRSFSKPQNGQGLRGRSQLIYSGNHVGLTLSSRGYLSQMSSS